MKIKEIEKKPAPKFGTTRKRVKFAYFPTLVGTALIWLELFEVLEVWSVDAYTVEIDGTAAVFHLGKWVELSKRRFV